MFELISERQPIVVCGSGGHARVVLDILERDDRYAVQGVLDPYRQPGELVSDYVVLGNYESVANLSSAIHGIVVAIGDNWVRMNVVRHLESLAPDVPFVTAVHPNAVVARDVEVGPGTVIAAGAIVNAGSRIGCHCILNTHSSVDHDVRLGDFVSIGPGAALGGNVTADNYVVIGLGANIIHRTRIGEHTVVGAGATVVRDVPAFVVSYGAPARIVRSRRPGEPYL